MTGPVRVARVWRYPVKSMRGQTAPSIEVGASGVQGDRRYALRDAAGRLGSGKSTRRFRRIDGLLGYSAGYRDHAVVVVGPDGRELPADDPETGEILAEALGHDVVLERVDDGSHLDDGPVHLLTTASLAWLERTLPGVAADERRFRPNVVIEAGGDAPVEQDWIGATLRVGDDVVLRITHPTERCGMVALAQDDLPRDPRVLRHITQEADLLFGVYAEVVAPGRIHAGDAILLEPAA